jgi:hypothetical protein
LELKIVKKKITENIIIDKETEFSQNIGLDDVESIINEAYPEAAKEFIADNKKLQEILDVRTKVKEIIISYLDGSKEYYALIEKEVSVENKDGLNNLAIIESIPKSIIENANEIDFKTSGYNILKKDPIIKWSIDGNTRKIKYILNKQLYQDEAKKIKLVLINFGDKTEDTTKEENKITGYAGLKGISKLVGNFRGTIFFIVGLLIYYIVLKKKNSSNIVIKKNIPKIVKLKKDKPKDYVKKAIKKIGVSKAVSSLNKWLQSSR